MADIKTYTWRDPRPVTLVMTLVMACYVLVLVMNYVGIRLAIGLMLGFAAVSFTVTLIFASPTLLFAGFALFYPGF